MRILVRNAQGEEVRRMTIPQGEDPNLQIVPGETYEDITGREHAQ